MSSLQAADEAVGLSADAGVPMNLKATDPKKINKREFEPPEIKDGGEVKNSDNQQFQQQMMMMMLQMALGGIMAPMGGMVGGMMGMPSGG